MPADNKIDIEDIRAQVEAAAKEVDAAISESEAQLDAAHAELSQVASEVQARKEKIAEMESNPLPDEPDLETEAGEAGRGDRSEKAFEGAELSHQVMHTIENVAEQIVEHRHHAAASKELQWFYVEAEERLGPVSQSKLLEMLERGDIPWTTLVWNKKFSDWAKASETELVDQSQEPPPPPLPPPLPSAKKQTEKGQKCKSCGRANSPNDRFCAGCGKPLKRSSK